MSLPTTIRWESRKPLLWRSPSPRPRTLSLCERNIELREIESFLHLHRVKCIHVQVPASDVKSVIGSTVLAPSPAAAHLAIERGSTNLAGIQPQIQRRESSLGRIRGGESASAVFQTAHPGRGFWPASTKKQEKARKSLLIPSTTSQCWDRRSRFGPFWEAEPGFDLVFAFVC